MNKEMKDCSNGRPMTETRYPHARRRERWTGDVIRLDGGLSPRTLTAVSATENLFIYVFINLGLFIQ